MLKIEDIMFFCESFNFSFDLDENLKQFNLFLEFLMNNNISLESEEDYKLILSKSSVIKHIIEIIVKKNYGNIVSNNLYKLGYSTILNKFILIYCELENIKIKSRRIEYYDSEDDSYQSCSSLFLKDISQYDLLTEEEVNQLFEEYKETYSSEIRDYIINCNLRLVFHFASKMKRSVNDLDDLIQVGCEGLVHAFDFFDIKRGVKFSTYASEAIKNSIRNFYSRFINLNNKDNSKIKYFYYKFTTEQNREPTVDELSNISGVPYEKVYYFLNNISIFISLDATKKNVGDEDDSLTGLTDDETVASLENMYLDKELKDSLRQSLNYLNEREYIIIKELFYGEEEKVNCATVGLELNLTRERIRQIKLAAFKKIRRYLYLYNNSCPIFHPCFLSDNMNAENVIESINKLKFSLKERYKLYNFDSKFFNDMINKEVALMFHLKFKNVSNYISSLYTYVCDAIDNYIKCMNIYIPTPIEDKKKKRNVKKIRKKEKNNS